jgi:hypothetical protein
MVLRVLYKGQYRSVPRHLRILIVIFVAAARVQAIKSSIGPILDSNASAGGILDTDGYPRSYQVRRVLHPGRPGLCLCCNQYSRILPLPIVEQSAAEGSNARGLRVRAHLWRGCSFLPGMQLLFRPSIVFRQSLSLQSVPSGSHICDNSHQCAERRQSCLIARSWRLRNWSCARCPWTQNRTAREMLHCFLTFTIPPRGSVNFC